MAKNKATNIELALNLSIPKEDLDVFESVSGDDGVGAYIANCVTNYLLAYAKGGLMLSPEDVREISDATGDEVASSADIVRAATRKAESSDSGDGLRVHIDPALVQNIQDSASVVGISVEDWLNNCWGHIIANGWLYEISANIRWIPFPIGRIRELEKAYGKPLDSSSSICDVLAEGLGA